MKKKAKHKNESAINAASAIKAHPFYLIVVALWLVYLYFFFQSPNTSSGQIHVSTETLNALRLTVALPYLLIWLGGTYAYIRIKRYAVGIKPSIESPAFSKIAGSILFLLSSLLLSTLLSTLRTYFVNYPEVRPILTILTNYAYVLPYLVAFILLFNGVKDLMRQNTQVKIPSATYIIFGIPLIFFAYIWLEVIFSNQTRLTPGQGSPFATYYLRDSLLILTIVIPSLITWATGIFTIIKLRMYFKKVKGVLYKRALSFLVNGLSSVIIGSIFLQALMALGSQRLIVLGLGRLLILVYIFLFVQALGFFFIARGANKLTKIETV